MTVGFDKLKVNRLLDLSLPMREGSGLVTYDVSKNRYPLTFFGTPTWEVIASGLTVIEFVSIAPWIPEYLRAAAPALNYTTEDFSMAVWIDPDGYGTILCRGEPNGSIDGWELELDSSHRIGLNMFNAGGISRASSDTGYAYNTWQLVGVSRSGITTHIYRNGEDVTFDSLMADCSTSARNLYVGIWEGGIQYPYKGRMWNPRTMGNVALTPEDHKLIFEMERRWFGV